MIVACNEAISSWIYTDNLDAKVRILYNKEEVSKMESKKYNEEFKQSIVSLYSSGKSSSEICREYGMSSSTLHKWIKQNTQVKVSDTETLTVAEIKRLQKKLAL